LGIQGVNGITESAKLIKILHNKTRRSFLGLGRGLGFLCRWFFRNG
jgi:hypothetical protein